MPVEDFIITMYCLVADSQIFDKKSDYRRTKQLTDAEVVTMEIVGEYLGYDTDVGIYNYFKQHWLKLFSRLPSRTQLTRQMIKCGDGKIALIECLMKGNRTTGLHIIDGFPIPICHYARAKNSKVLSNEASFGYCAVKKEKYFGFKGHILIDGYTGRLAGVSITPANQSEREEASLMATSLLKRGQLLADKGYISKELSSCLKKHHIELIVPSRKNMIDPLTKPIRKQYNAKRRLVETVIGILSTRFNIQKNWAREISSFIGRITRKLLSYELCTKVQGSLKLTLLLN